MIFLKFRPIQVVVLQFSRSLVTQNYSFNTSKNSTQIWRIWGKSWPWKMFSALQNWERWWDKRMEIILRLWIKWKQMRFMTSSLRYSKIWPNSRGSTKLWFSRKKSLKSGSSNLRALFFRHLKSLKISKRKIKNLNRNQL